MKKFETIKTQQGRVTIQKNSFGIPEIKVRINGETHKVRCRYSSIEELKIVVDSLLDSERI